MTNSRKPLLGLIALGAALAMPMAFAQEATTATPQDPAQSTAPAATEQPLTWADLDVDGNGTLSQAEAGNLQSLAQVFNDADSDSDGELTPDEYKAYVAS
ncbi:MAG TPA: EF-hand domain-containing protein, partial [Luteimonas sp.]|nr:EF-hand domain-containing protein [Luteimonas sp.]